MKILFSRHLPLWVSEDLDQICSFCCRKGEPLPGPERGLLINIQKWIAWGDTHADKVRDIIGKGQEGEQEGQGIQEDCCATWLTVLAFMVTGLVSRLPLANHSDSGSLLVAHTLLSQDGRQQEGFWEVVGHMASSFDLSRILLVGGSLLVLCSLQGFLS